MAGLHAPWTPLASWASNPAARSPAASRGYSLGSMPGTIESHQAMPLLARAAAGETLEADQARTAARFALRELAQRHPGRSVEVRIPFAGAVQILPGPSHRRGTPPNVVEMAIGVFVDLCVGRSTWDEAVAAAEVSASGVRASLSGLVPLYGDAILARWR